MSEENNQPHLTVARRIIGRLKMFNRKERDHLIKFALCEEPQSPKISNRLWDEILETGADIPEVEDYFIAMDFHMNWLFAALATSPIEGDIQYIQWKNCAEVIAPEQIDEDCEGPIRGNQQDVDLLVAWIDRKSSRLKICLIEAKLESGWTSKQLISKRDRLRQILEAAGQKLQNANGENTRADLSFVDFSFLLCSPSKPEKWKLDWPQLGFDELWTVDYFAFKSQNKLLQVKRVSENSDYWEIVPTVSKGK